MSFLLRPLVGLALTTLALTAGGHSRLHAQVLPGDTAVADTAALDTAAVDTPTADTAAAVAQESVPTYVPPYSAHSALIRSLVLPGWGQAYVDAPGRGAFYFALEAGSLWMVYKSDRALAAARKRESELREAGRLGLQQRDSLAQTRAQQVEDWITLSIFWALFSAADAYVSAQLADFPGHVGAAPGANGEARFQVRVNVGGPR